ncbi:MAG: hypothetical protein J6C96_01180 [Oscillospiraceae bacterium]|nr:hypothetical protein [Oscillospiraceae bacterium]
MFELSSSLLAHEPPYIVYLRCECGAEIDVDTDNFEIVKDKYVVLKEGITVTCSECSRSQPDDERYIPLENQHSGNLHIPTCPTCGSTKIEKISTASKAIGFVAVGVFSSNFGKTFKCKQCGYKF